MACNHVAARMVKIPEHFSSGIVGMLWLCLHIPHTGERMRTITLAICVMLALPVDCRSATGYTPYQPPSYFNPRSPSSYNYPTAPGRAGLSQSEYDSRMRYYERDRTEIDRQRAERDRGQREYMRRHDEAARANEALQGRQRQLERDARDFQRRDDGMYRHGGSLPRQPEAEIEAPRSTGGFDDAAERRGSMPTVSQPFRPGPFEPGQLQPNQPVPNPLAPPIQPPNGPRRSERSKTK